MTITSNFIGIGTPPIQATMLEDTFKVTIKEADGTPTVENVKTIVVSNGTLTDDGNGQVTLATGGSGGAGTVTSVSVTTANGVSGSVANATTTPAISLTLGAITPTSVASSGNVTGTNLSGTNTGDQTITLTGDVTGSGTGSFATTIANDAVTYAKIQNVAANSVLARADSSSGDVSAVAISASQLFGRGSTGDLTPITLGAGLTMSGTTLHVSGGGGFSSFTDYTPTLTVTGGGSVSSSTINDCAYAFSGDVMMIRGSIEATCTSGDILYITLPPGITGATVVGSSQVASYTVTSKSGVGYLTTPFISSNDTKLGFYATNNAFDYVGTVNLDFVLLFEVQGAP